MGFIDHKYLLAATALLAAGACTPSGNDDPAASADLAHPAAFADPIGEVPAADTAPAPAGDELATLPISFAPCAEDPELQCGALAVPIDYARPHGPRVTLAAIKAPARTAHKKGVIFVNPGGPGGSGVDFVVFAKPLFEALRAQFDIVSFDPRGVARSSQVSCTLQLPPLPGDGSLPALAAFLDQASGLLAQACAEQNGGLATQIGTNNVARDMDRLRAALGERELNYLGFSYGTILGASYATLFPQRVRAMVLDSNVTPVWLGDYLLELDGEGSAGAELALRRLDQLCRADAACPLRQAGVVATLDRLVERYDRSPVVTEAGIVDGSVIRGQTFGLLYNERFGWPLIAQTLALADAGDLRGIRPVPPSPGDTLTIEPTFAIICNDSRTRRSALDYLPAQLEQQALSPHFGSVNLGLAITACTRWPATPLTPLGNARTRHPIVMIGNDFDPATPMAWSRNMATALGSPATLVRYRGGGHTIYGSGSACVDEAIHAYFRDPSAPPQHLTCPAQPISFAPRPLPPQGQTQAEARQAQARGDATMADVLRAVTPQPAQLPRRR